MTDVTMTQAEHELEVLRLRAARGLAGHLGHRIHRIREDRRKQRELIDEARRIVGEVGPLLADDQFKYTAAAEAFAPLTTLFFPPERATPEAIARRRARLEAKRLARDGTAGAVVAEGVPA